jgi:transcriptional regulator with XRE-family HTH domain
MKKNKNNDSGKIRIGKNIRKWRNIKDIKQKDLAIALQISEASVSNIENDISEITVCQLEEISIAMNLSMEQLLSDPQANYGRSNINDRPHYGNEGDHLIEKELLNAFINSLEKKDQQMQIIMQNFLQVINSLFQQDHLMFNASKQVTSRV